MRRWTCSRRRSYGATPVPMLADSAGVAAGTIYRYFPGKEGVVNALYQRWKSASATAILDGLDPDDAPSDAFDGIWRRLCGFVIENPTAFAFLGDAPPSAVPVGRQPTNRRGPRPLDERTRE